MEFKAPTPIIAFVLAMVAGTLRAVGSYVAGGTLAVAAIVLFGLWRFAEERGDDGTHTIWRQTRLPHQRPPWVGRFFLGISQGKTPNPLCPAPQRVRDAAA
jgi:glutathione S-transferase